MKFSKPAPEPISKIPGPSGELVMKSRWKLVKRILILTLIGLPLVVGLEARPKTDVVILENGDHITGEIKKLERGKLKLKTDWMGTLEIEWKRIEKIESEFFFEVELSSGVKHFGSIKSNEEQRKKIDIDSAYASNESDHMGIVGLTPIEKNFLDRIDFSVEAGYNYTRANRSTEFNLGTNAKYRVEKYLLTGNYSSLYKSQGESLPTKRNEVGVDFSRFMKKRWFVVGLSNFLQSDELSLNLRSIFGGGAGRNLIHTNRIVFSVFGGAVANRENYIDESIRTSGEGLIGLRFQTFKFDRPEMDLTTAFNTIPSLTEKGRVRLDFDAQARIEIIKDLFFHITLFNNYDSKPPEGAEKNDFGINTGVGWSF
jgi:putative salt-induced outer membrane protein YdiY